MVIELSYTTNPTYFYDVGAGRIAGAVTDFQMEVANTGPALPSAAKPFGGELLDGQLWELPVKQRQKQSIQTLPNLLIDGYKDPVTGVFSPWKEMLRKWYYAPARWIATSDLGGDVKVVRGSDDLGFEQLEGINFAERVSFEVTTAAVGDTASVVDPGLPSTLQTLGGAMQLMSVDLAGFTETDGMTHVAPRVSQMLENIVFTLRDDLGNEQFSFDLGIIPRSLAPQYEELAVSSPIGPVGTGIWKINGELSIFQNNRDSINALKQHQGRVFEMHMRYRDGTCTSSTTINSTGQLINSGSYNNGYSWDRFQNMAPYRSQFGVVFQVKESPSDWRRARISIAGATADKFDYFMAGNDFYKLFGKLNTPAPFLSRHHS